MPSTNFGPIASAPITGFATSRGTTFHPAAGVLQFGGAIPGFDHTFVFAPGGGRFVFAGAYPNFVQANKLSYIGEEVLHSGSSVARESFLGLEVLRALTAINPRAQVSWQGVEVLNPDHAYARVTLQGVEVLRAGHVNRKPQIVRHRTKQMAA